MTNDVLDHDTFNKYLEQTPLTTEQAKEMQYLYDVAAKSTAATKGKKSVQEWKKEMKKDHEAFRTFIKNTEKYVLMLLQRHTKGEAKDQVLGIQIGPCCGREAYADLTRLV